MAFDAGTLPRVRRGVKSPTTYIIVGGKSVPDGAQPSRTAYYTYPEVIRGLERAPDGAYVYLVQFGARKSDDVWVKEGARLVHLVGAPARNPALTIVRNPGRSRSRDGQVLTNRVLAIQYIHGADGKAYEHKFKRGVTVEFLPDGSARLYRKDGRPLWKDC